MTDQKAQESGTDRLAGVVADTIQGARLSFGLAMLMGVVAVEGSLVCKGLAVLPPWFGTGAGCLAVEGGPIVGIVAAGIVMMRGDAGAAARVLFAVFASTFVLVPLGLMSFLADDGSASLPGRMSWFAGILASAAGWVVPVVTLAALFFKRDRQR